MLTYLPQLLGSAITILGATAIRIAMKSLTDKYVRRHASFELKATHLNRITTIFFNIAVVIVIIVIWGVDTKNLFVALSSVFAVIGVALFAQWSILSNITAGFILFFSPPFRIGNYIRLMDNDLMLEAKVVDIFTFYTHLRGRDGKLYIFPNILLLQKSISIVDQDLIETEDQPEQKID